MSNKKLKDINLLENQTKYKKTGNFFSAGVDGTVFNLQEKIQEALNEGELYVGVPSKKLIIGVAQGGVYQIIVNQLGVNPTATYSNTEKKLTLTFPGYNFIYQGITSGYNLTCLYSQSISDGSITAGAISNIYVDAVGTNITIETDVQLAADVDDVNIYDFTYYPNSNIINLSPTNI